MLRDPRARLSLIIPPIIQLFVFSSAATMEVKTSPWRSWISTATVRPRRAAAPGGLAQLHPAARATRTSPPPAAHSSASRSSESWFLPSGFSADLTAGRPASAQLLLDGRRSNAAQISAQYVSTIIAARACP